MRPLGHHPRKANLGLAELFSQCHRNVIGRFRCHYPEGIVDRQAGAAPEAEPGRGHAYGTCGHRHPVGQRQFAAINRFKRHIERHDLGNRSRGTQGIGAPSIQHLPGFRIDKYGSIFRLIEQAHRRSRRGGSSCHHDKGGDRKAGSKTWQFAR